ncbi:MAG: hypothetical protein RBR93_12675 [Aliarcobacter butzleri]|nr:hypothetical protein [Aliarcobacter butzleri]
MKSKKKLIYGVSLEDVFDEIRDKFENTPYAERFNFKVEMEVDSVVVIEYDIKTRFLKGKKNK